MASEDAYNPSKYSFGIFLMCTSEEEVAKSMEKLTIPLVGLALEGINVMMMRTNNEDDSKDD